MYNQKWMEVSVRLEINSVVAWQWSDRKPSHGECGSSCFPFSGSVLPIERLRMGARNRTGATRNESVPDPGHSLVLVHRSALSESVQEREGRTEAGRSDPGFPAAQQISCVLQGHFVLSAREHDA